MYLASLFIDRGENNAHRILVFGILCLTMSLNTKANKHLIEIYF